MKAQNNKKSSKLLENSFYSNEFIRYFILYFLLFFLIIISPASNTDAEKSTTHKICTNAKFTSSLYANSALQAFRSEGYDAIFWHSPIDTRCLHVTYFDELSNKVITYNTGIWYEYEKQFCTLCSFSANDSGKTFSDIASAEKTLTSLKELMIIWSNEKSKNICFSFYTDSSKNKICTFESEIPAEKWEEIRELLVAFVISQQK